MNKLINANNEKFGKFEIEVTDIHAVNYEDCDSAALAFIVKTEKGSQECVEWMKLDDFSDTFIIETIDSHLKTNQSHQLEVLFDKEDSHSELCNIVLSEIQNWLNDNKEEILKHREIQLSL